MQMMRARGISDAVDPQVTLARWRSAQVNRFIRHAHVKGRAVGIGVNRDGPNLHLAQRADDAYSDFTAIGDQNFVEHFSWRQTYLRAAGEPGRNASSSPAAFTLFDATSRHASGICDTSSSLSMLSSSIPTQPSTPT